MSINNIAINQINSINIYPQTTSQSPSNHHRNQHALFQNGMLGQQLQAALNNNFMQDNTTSAHTKHPLPTHYQQPFNPNHPLAHQMLDLLGPKNSTPMGKVNIPKASKNPQKKHTESSQSRRDSNIPKKTNLQKP